jgi:hypothetical protein
MVIDIKALIILNENIIDFQVSDEEIYGSLVVLTERHLYFYILEGQMACLVSTFDFQSTPICAKLGWGSSSS